MIEPALVIGEAVRGDVVKAIAPVVDVTSLVVSEIVKLDVVVDGRAAVVGDVVKAEVVIGGDPVEIGDRVSSVEVSTPELNGDVVNWADVISPPDVTSI